MLAGPAPPFYRGLVAERQRLYRLFPKVTSEIKRIRPDEQLGLKTPPGKMMLTIDDGPSRHLKKILDILDQEGVQGRFFFIVGRIGPQDADLVRRAEKQGHIVGQHSFHHRNMAAMPAEAVAEELKRATEDLEAVTGRPVRWFRAPFGLRDREVLAAADKLGQKHLLWNIDALDWRSDLSFSRVRERVLRISLLFNGGILLLHETERLPGRLPRLIRDLKAEGFVFVSTPGFPPQGARRVQRPEAP
jgi:peptidoglycan/xylan/chitin deacetylase (PgdA/CDA1 family)